MMHNPRAQKKLYQSFKIVDGNGDNTISWEEIKELCKNMNIPVTHDDYRAFASSDVNKDQKLDFNEFCRFATIRLKKVFNDIDKDKSGTLEAHEIHRILEKLNLTVSPREIDAILHGMDRDGDSVIDFDEFCEFFADIPTFDVRTVASRWLCGIGIDIGVDQMAYSMPPIEMPVYRFMLAGGIAVAVSKTTVAPLEKIKILSEVSKTGKLKITSTFKKIFTREGIHGLYSGNLTNCIRLIPNGAIVGLVYSNMIKYTPVDNIRDPHQPLWRLISGATAGIISNVTTYPLDVVRTRLTVQDSSKNNLRRYTGITNTVKRITAEEGFRGLYKGMTPALVSIAPFVGIQQCLYDVSKLHLTNTEFAKHPATFLACGALAGTVAQTAIHPLEVIRRCMQVEEDLTSKTFKDQYKKKLFRAELKTLWRQGGIKRLYAGWTASCLKIVPSATISLIIRDSLLGRMKKNEIDL